MQNDQQSKKINYRVEAIAAFIYFCIYFGCLFFTLESEFEHWLTLVIIPFVLLYLYYKTRKQSLSFRDSLASIGLRKSNLTRGLIWAIFLGLALSILQLFMSNRKNAMLELLRSGKAFLLFPVALLLLLLTAGFTEEFFFRGVLQTRFSKVFNSRLWAVLVTSILFSLYHLPYAFLHPQWPSYGNLGAAFSAAFGDGMPGGLVLGAVYEYTDNNLLACILVHALIDVLPAMTLIKFQFG